MGQKKLKVYDNITLYKASAERLPFKDYTFDFYTISFGIRNVSDINQTLENPVGHNHDKLICDITVGTDIGFRFNKVTDAYELVTDLQTWNRSIPPKVFLDKVTQQYAVNTIVNTVEDDGFTILENKKTLDGSIELTCTKWD